MIWLDATSSTLSNIVNKLGVQAWIQTSLPIRDGNLGARNVAHLGFGPFRLFGLSCGNSQTPGHHFVEGGAEHRRFRAPCWTMAGESCSSWSYCRAFFMDKLIWTFTVPIQGFNIPCRGLAQGIARCILWSQIYVNPFATGDVYMRQLFHCLQWYAGSERVKRG